MCFGSFPVSFCFSKLPPSRLLSLILSHCPDYITPHPAFLHLVCFHSVTKTDVLYQKRKEVTGAGEEHGCPFGMCQLWQTNVEHDSSTNCERLVGLKSCFWVNKCQSDTMDILSNKINLPYKRSQHVVIQMMETNLNANKPSNSKYQHPHLFFLNFKTLSSYIKGIKKCKGRYKLGGKLIKISSDFAQIFQNLYIISLHHTYCHEGGSI